MSDVRDVEAGHMRGVEDLDVGEVSGGHPGTCCCVVDVPGLSLDGLRRGWSG